MAKFQIDLEKLKEELKKETPIAQMVQSFGFPKEASAYVHNAIKKLRKQGVDIIKVRPGVYAILDPKINDVEGSEEEEK